MGKNEDEGRSLFECIWKEVSLGVNRENTNRILVLHTYDTVAWTLLLLAFLFPHLLCALTY